MVDEDIFTSMWFDDAISPGDIKVVVLPKHRKVKTSFNTKGMFSEPNIDILVTASYSAYLATGDRSFVVGLYNLLCDSDKTIFAGFLDTCAEKGKVCVKILNVYNSIIQLSKYCVLVIADAVQFFKELKRLRRRSLTRKQSEYYFSWGGINE